MKNTYCTYCGSVYHPTSHCPKTYNGSANRARLRCAYCGGTDHNADACYRSRHLPGLSLVRCVAVRIELGT